MTDDLLQDINTRPEYLSFTANGAVAIRLNTSLNRSHISSYIKLCCATVYGEVRMMALTVLVRFESAYRRIPTQITKII